MKALGVLGTSSNSGKSWMATALCAWLRKRGYRIAPFKAQNMSNNSFATLDDGEIGRAQAVQAEACGLVPTVEMNPILLKPSGKSGSQLVVLGKAQRHLTAQEYYKEVDQLWEKVAQTLDDWRKHVDVLVLEGAGSPVELNLKSRDIVNLRPLHYLNGKWVLVADIERGGVFAQAIGTWQLLNESDRSRGLGLIVNKFRGNLELFSDAQKHFEAHIKLPYLGTLPFRNDLQPESEDSLCREAEENYKGHTIACIRFPHLSNSQDIQPWLLDEGVGVKWATHPKDLNEAKIIILPGSKNTISDLRWLRETGLDLAIQSASKQGHLVIGVCGGYQMLGLTLSDPEGIAGNAGSVKGLELLPMKTVFKKEKQVRQVEALWERDRWMAYEIHMGKSEFVESIQPLIQIKNGSGAQSEGCRLTNVWGTYLHGFFESPAVRASIAKHAQLNSYQASNKSWRNHLQATYDAMADLLDEHLDMSPIQKYVES